MKALQLRSHLKRQATVGLVLIATSVSVVACSSSTSAGGASGSSGSTGSSASADAAGVAAATAALAGHVATPAKINQTVPLSKPAPTGKTLIFLNNTQPTLVPTDKAMREATAAIGWSYESLGWDTANIATLNSAAMTALSKHASVVAVAGASQPELSAATLSAYKSAGVPLIVASACPVVATDPVVAGPATCASEEPPARALADWFVSDSKGQGKAIFQDMQSVASHAAFVKYFQDEVSKKCPGCQVKLMVTTPQQYTQNQIVPSMVSTLRSNPSYTYAFFTVGQYAAGIVPALSAAGLSGIKVGGRGMDSGALTGLQQGSEAAWTATSYFMVGYGIVDVALRALTDSSGLTGDAVIPFQLVTASSSTGVSNPYNAPTDALQQYLKLWGVSK